jgi:hypothetical protein
VRRSEAAGAAILVDRAAQQDQAAGGPLVFFTQAQPQDCARLAASVPAAPTPSYLFSRWGEELISFICHAVRSAVSNASKQGKSVKKRCTVLAAAAANQAFRVFK